jgi:diguanylate cyclase (GGDEF)-like protein
MWIANAIASLGIALAYYGITYFIARGLASSKQLRTNPLGLGTALIFFSCGTGHLIHAEHALFGGPAFRAAADLHMTVWDISTAVIAVWYLSMRARYGQLLHSPVALFDDNTRVAADDEARHAADHDHLTGLLNRQALLKWVGDALDPDAGDESRALLFLDLDGFKEVNDRFGHRAGDALLIATVERLRHTSRPDDLLARMGGDEFVILLDGPATRDHAAAVAARHGEALRAPFMIDGHMVTITTSIGIAVANPGEMSASELLHRADLAMYDAKHEGPGRYSLDPARPTALA